MKWCPRYFRVMVGVFYYLFERYRIRFVKFYDDYHWLIYWWGNMEQVVGSYSIVELELTLAWKEASVQAFDCLDLAQCVIPYILETCFLNSDSMAHQYSCNPSVYLGFLDFAELWASYLVKIWSNLLATVDFMDWIIVNMIMIYFSNFWIFKMLLSQKKCQDRTMSWTVSTLCPFLHFGASD